MKVFWGWVLATVGGAAVQGAILTEPGETFWERSFWGCCLWFGLIAFISGIDQLGLFWWKKRERE